MLPRSLSPSLDQLWSALSPLDVPLCMSFGDGRIVRCNPAMERLTGYSSAEAMDSVTMSERLFPRPEDRVRVLPARPGACGGEGKDAPVEALMIRKGGAPCWVELSRYEPREGTASRGCTIVQAIDINGRKRAEQESRDWKQRYEHFAVASGQIAYECSSLAGTVSLGGSVEQVLGYAPSELDGSMEQWSDLIHPDDRAEVDRLYEEALGGGSRFQAEYRFRHREGRYLRVLDRGFPVAATAERPARMIGTMQDVTALREMETALRESEERFRTLVQESSDVLAIYDARGCFQYVSPSVERLFGYPAAMLLGTSAFDLMHADDRAEGREAFQRVVAGTESHRPHHFRIRHADGRWTHVETLARNLLTHPQIRGIVVTHRDVSERAAAEQQLAHLQEQLLQSQKMEAIGRLAGGVAHDFNNLLTSIIGYSDLLLREEKVSGEVREGIQEIESAAYRAADLTRRLLAFSRKQVLQPRVVDLNVLIVNLERMLQRMIGEDVSLLAGRDPALGRIRADPGQIEQVIINLAVNARDAMPEGGTLRIDTANASLAPGALINHAPVEPGPYVMVTVSDTGTGMSEEVKSHLFEPFFTTKDPGRGTGLGLATVYGIVRQSGGHIDVDSAPGKGATFRVYFPRVEDALVVDPEASGDFGEHRGNETILVVEDEEPLLRMIVKTLQACGYLIIGAGSAAEALHALDGERGRRIDLLVTDVVMPNTGGPELAREIGRRRPGTKVLFMSGYTGDAFNEEHLYETGTGFIAKPFSLKDLASKMREILDG